MSEKLQAAELNYPAHEKELLALVVALKHWRHYLWLRSDTLAYTDSTFLTHLRTQEVVSPRQARWLSTISQYSPTIIHIPGTTNVVADALSRVNVLGPLLDVSQENK